MNMTSPNQKASGMDMWRFTLYKAGDTPAAMRAQSTLRRLCDRFVPDRYAIKVVNILDAPGDTPLDILAVPTVVRTSPSPERRVVGSFAKAGKAAEALGLMEAAEEV